RFWMLRQALLDVRFELRGRDRFAIQRNQSVGIQLHEQPFAGGRRFTDRARWLDGESVGVRHLCGQHEENQQQKDDVGQRQYALVIVGTASWSGESHAVQSSLWLPGLCMSDRWPAPT